MLTSFRYRAAALAVMFATSAYLVGGRTIESAHAQGSPYEHSPEQRKQDHDNTMKNYVRVIKSGWKVTEFSGCKYLFVPDLHEQEQAEAELNVALHREWWHSPEGEQAVKEKEDATAGFAVALLEAPESGVPAGQPKTPAQEEADKKHEEAKKAYDEASEEAYKKYHEAEEKGVKKLLWEVRLEFLKGFLKGYFLPIAVCDVAIIQVPGPTSFVTIAATDTTTWCARGEGVSIPVVLTPTDDAGNPIAPTELVGLPAPPDRWPTTSDRPSPPTHASPPATTSPPTTDRPTTTATAPPTPPTTTDAPPTPVTPPTTDTPPQIPDTVFVKANEAVLAGGQTGSELQNQTVKLVFAKPDLPGTGASKTAQDTGFDRDPAQCTTGANGECKIQVHPDDRPLYGLASAGAKPGHHRLDLNLLKHSGAVAETTGKTVPDLKNATPAGGNIATSEFKIGNRKFTRLGIDEPYGRSEDRAAYSRALGSNAETDYCRTKKPGPLGMEPTSLGALNHELPESTLRLKNRTDGMR